MLSLAAALLALDRWILWLVWLVMSLHALTRLRSTPLLATIMLPWAVGDATDAAGVLAAAAYAFFYTAYEMEDDHANPKAPEAPPVPPEGCDDL